jgi:hypothetical protein
MPDDTYEYRPLISRHDWNPAERDAVRSGTMILLALAVTVGFAAITTLVLPSPGTNEMIEMIGP